MSNECKRFSVESGSYQYVAINTYFFAITAHVYFHFHLNASFASSAILAISLADLSVYKAIKTYYVLE